MRSTRPCNLERQFGVTLSTSGANRPYSSNFHPKFHLFEQRATALFLLNAFRLETLNRNLK